MDIPSLEEFAPDPFLEKLERLNRLYQDMGVALGVEKEILEEEREASEVRDPVSYEVEHSIFDEQRYDLEECEKIRAEFILVSLATAVRELLDEAKLDLERIPVGSSAHSGKGPRAKKSRGNWLVKRFRGFFSKFAIDLAEGPRWADVEEVIMARDAVIHPESVKTYRNSRPNPHYLNGEVRLTHQELVATIERLREFGAWLRAQVKARREQNRQMGDHAG